MKIIQEIFDKVKDKYPLLLTDTGKLADEGFTISVPVICGESELGRFWLYREDEEHDPLLVFSYELSESYGGGYGHGHPYSVEQSIEHIEQFMNCKTEFFE